MKKRASTALLSASFLAFGPALHLGPHTHPAFHCNAFQCFAIHHFAMHCLCKKYLTPTLTVHFTVVHFTVVHFATLHCSQEVFNAQFQLGPHTPCISLQCIAIRAGHAYAKYVDYAPIRNMRNMRMRIENLIHIFHVQRGKNSIFKRQ